MNEHLKYAKHEVVSLKDHPQFNEFWVRDRIVDDPSILGLGSELYVKDVERAQPKGGRLDLLLIDSDTDRRYEVEIMLGKVDESHIIRTIEYWDIERKRYPQYDHCAVLVAEEITSRFLNVIGLFNSVIPMIAIQCTPIKIGDQILLQFTKVLDEIERGEDDEDDDFEEAAADRSYWEKRGSKPSLMVADSCLSLLREIDPSISLSYRRQYIGLTVNGAVNNFVAFKAKKQFLRVEAKTREDKEGWLSRLEEAGLVTFPGAPQRKRVVFRIEQKDIQTHHDLLKQIFTVCYKNNKE
ncbi:MAG: hypothetical protein EPN55_01050 [Gammaproteobacteria bacterium]|nr:MAG: hypothetical protein EPN55_01050 [Gammaproteobacteria bacterium]